MEGIEMILAELPVVPNVKSNSTEGVPAHNLLMSVTQVDVQKKKRQRRATPPAASSSAGKAESIDEAIDAINMPPSSLVDGGVSSNGVSGVPDGSTLLPTAEQFLGEDVSIRKPTAKPTKYRAPYEGDMEVADNHLSKAATRMRKYRADHRHDQLWLAKEAERMRNMRASRKAGSAGVISINLKNEKPKKEKVNRRKEEKKVALAELAPTEKFNHEEYLRKEAERVRKYRALKQLDPEWKKNDSDRMKLYRAKRKSDGGKGSPSSSDVMDILIPLPLDESSSTPSHSLLQPADKVKADESDSEDEGQV